MNAPMDYTAPGNSNKQKTQAQVPEKEEKKFQPVVTDGFIQKKKGLGKRFKEVFFGGDFHSTARYVAADVLLPAFRNLVADSVNKAVDRLIFGESVSNRRRPVEYRGNIQYNTIARPATPAYSHLPDQPRYYPGGVRPRNRNVLNNEIIITDRRQAEEVIEQLSSAIEKYGVVSVGDLYDLIGHQSTHIDHKWGWDRLNTAEVRQVQDGYLLDLPSPQEIAS